MSLTLEELHESHEDLVRLTRQLSCVTNPYLLFDKYNKDVKEIVRKYTDFPYIFNYIAVACDGVGITTKDKVNHLLEALETEDKLSEEILINILIDLLTFIEPKYNEYAVERVKELNIKYNK